MELKRESVYGDRGGPDRSARVPRSGGQAPRRGQRATAVPRGTTTEEQGAYFPGTPAADRPKAFVRAARVQAQLRCIAPPPRKQPPRAQPTASPRCRAARSSSLQAQLCIAPPRRRAHKPTASPRGRAARSSSLQVQRSPRGSWASSSAGEGCAEREPPSAAQVETQPGGAPQSAAPHLDRAARRRPSRRPASGASRRARCRQRTRVPPGRQRNAARAPGAARGCRRPARRSRADLRASRGRPRAGSTHSPSFISSGDQVGPPAGLPDVPRGTPQIPDRPPSSHPFLGWLDRLPISVVLADLLARPSGHHAGGPCHSFSRS